MTEAEADATVREIVEWWVDRREEIGRPVPEEAQRALTRLGLLVPRVPMAVGEVGRMP